MFGRSGKAETPESLRADAAAAAERVEAEEVRRAALVAVLDGESDLDRREFLREELARCDRKIADGKDLHETRLARADRLEQELALAALDPQRRDVAAGEAKANALRRELAEVESSVAAKRERLEDLEEAIRNPRPSESEEAEIRWVRQQWLSGGDVEAFLARMPRRLQKIARAQMESIAAGVGDAVADQRRRARKTWEEAGIPQAEPMQALDVPSVEIPQARPAEPPYVKLS
jgi:hypothetical protein